MIVFIDNYDSFTYNLVQAMLTEGADIRVFRNDEITVENHPVEFSIVKPGETILPEGEPESLVEIA